MLKKPVVRHEVIQPLDQPYRFIPLTQGQTAIVDATNFDWLNQWNWYAHYNQYTHSFYAQRFDNKNRKTIHMSREILKCKLEEEADHRDGNTLNNRKKNLRPATHSQNQINRGIQSNNTSGFMGVTYGGRKNRWRARISINGHIIHLGYFQTAEKAAHTYDEAAKKYHGKFAVLNFP